MMKAWGVDALAILLLGLFGCGGLRYSHVSPEAKDFHPRRIAVLPAEVKTFPEAKGSIDSLISQALSERKWFAAVVGGEEIGRRLETDETPREGGAEDL